MSLVPPPPGSATGIFSCHLHILWTLKPLAEKLFCELKNIFIARKRSLRRLCFYRCLSFCPQGGRGWLLPGGGVVGCLGGACVVALGGGMRGCSRGGRAWFFRWDTVNERAVRILLECILVKIIFQDLSPPHKKTDAPRTPVSCWLLLTLDGANWF